MALDVWKIVILSYIVLDISKTVAPLDNIQSCMALSISKTVQEKKTAN